MVKTRRPGGEGLRGVGGCGIVSPMTEEKVFYRSRDDRVWLGVCGGLAAYFDWRSIIVRIVWIAASILSGGIGVLVYLFLWLIVPEEPSGE